MSRDLFLINAEAEEFDQLPDTFREFRGAKFLTFERQHSAKEFGEDGGKLNLITLLAIEKL